MFRPIATVVAFLLATATHAQSQAPAWAWAHTSTNSGGGGTGATDRNGNTYVTGRFANSNTVNFDGTPLQTAYGVSGYYGTCSYLVKYDPAGTVLWARPVGTLGDVSTLDVALDGAGNVYLTGSFSIVAAIGTDTVVSAGSDDLFVAKYDASGNQLWTTTLGGTKEERGYSITVDNAGNSYVAGNFNSDFTVAGTALVNAGNHDIFLAKLNPAGKVVWAKGIGGNQADMGLALSLDHSGNLYMTGWFSSSALDFGNGATIPKWGSTDFYVVRLDTSGKALWARAAGGGGTDQSYYLAVDKWNNCFIAGTYTSSVHFGTTTFNSAGSQDIFIAKYDSTGAVRWAQHAGGADYDFPGSLTADASGYCYFTGGFMSPSVSFGNYTFQNFGFPSIYRSTSFVVRYGPSGAVDWAFRPTSTGWCGIGGIGLDSADNFYMAGTYRDTLTLGATMLTTAPGGGEMFIAKMGASSPTGVPVAAPAGAYALYPNPVSSQLHIRRGGAAATETLQIFDGIGRLMLQTELSARESSVDLQQWPAGMYHVQVGGSWSSSVVKQ